MEASTITGLDGSPLLGMSLMSSQEQEPSRRRHHEGNGAEALGRMEASDFSEPWEKRSHAPSPPQPRADNQEATM